MTNLSMPEVFEACRVLFGPEVEVSVDFLKYLRPEGLRSAYRKKALETHPDLSNGFRKEERLMNQLFIEVHSAYQKLEPLVSGNVPLTFENKK